MEFAAFSPRMMSPQGKGSGNLIRSRVLANSDTKPGKTTHGEPAAAQRGSLGAMTRPPTCFTGALLIRALYMRATHVPETIFLPIALLRCMQATASWLGISSLLPMMNTTGIGPNANTCGSCNQW